MPALSSLSKLTKSRNGKVALGATAAGGVVVLGLLTRARSGGDPKLIPYSEVQDVNGVNSGAFPGLAPSGVSVGDFEAWMDQLGALADRVDALSQQQPGGNPSPTSLNLTTKAQRDAFGKAVLEASTPAQAAAWRAAIAKAMNQQAADDAAYKAAIAKALAK